MKKFWEILGWYGVVVILISYTMVGWSMMSPTSFIYQFLNITGAVGIGGSAFQKRAYQPVVVNAIWAAIALIAMIKNLF